jgi:uncharacterized membrane protein YecN with MAPEG domain
MSADPTDLDSQNLSAQQLWQSQAKEHDAMTIAEIHQSARTFQAKIRRRNALEYLGCVIAIVGIIPALLIRESWLIQLGGGLIMVATVFVAWQLHRRASGERVAEGAEALVDAYRRQLIRQRDALKSAASWYLAPFAPGMTLMLLGRWFQWHAPQRSVGLDHLIILLVGVVAVLVFLVVWLLNQRGAEGLQRRIEAL